MKKKTNILSVLLFAVIALTTISGCNKEGNTDLTTDIVGHYTSGSGSGAVDIIVTKIDNNTISITVDPVWTNSMTFATTHMNSATSFNLNSMSATYGTEREDMTGTGSYSANNIVVQVHTVRVNTTTNTTISTDDDTYTGSK